MQINFEISYFLSYSRCENIEIAYVDLVRLLYCEGGNTLLAVDTHPHEAVAVKEDFLQILELVEMERQNNCYGCCCKIRIHNSWIWVFLIYVIQGFEPLPLSLKRMMGNCCLMSCHSRDCYHFLYDNVEMVQQASLLHRDRKRKDSFVVVDDVVESNSSAAALVEEAEARIDCWKEDILGMGQLVVAVVVV